MYIIIYNIVLLCFAYRYDSTIHIPQAEKKLRPGRIKINPNIATSKDKFAAWVVLHCDVSNNVSHIILLVIPSVCCYIFVSKKKSNVFPKTK